MNNSLQCKSIQVSPSNSSRNSPLHSNPSTSPIKSQSKKTLRITSVPKLSPRPKSAIPSKRDKLPLSNPGPGEYNEDVTPIKEAY